MLGAVLTIAVTKNSNEEISGLTKINGTLFASQGNNIIQLTSGKYLLLF